MEPEAVRSDLVGDITPEPSGGSEVLAYWAIALLGALLIAGGAYGLALHGQSYIPEVSIAIGVAVTAPAILSMTYRRFLLYNIKTELERPAREFKAQATATIATAVSDLSKRYEQVLDEIAAAHRKQIQLLDSADRAGLIGLYDTRAEALVAFLPTLENSAGEIIVVGSSLKTLLFDHNKEFNDARRVLSLKKADVLFLLTHPCIADLRARQENRAFGDIGDEILHSLTFLLNTWQVPRERIKLYQGPPTCFGIKTSSAMLLNPYPYEQEAPDSPTFIVKSGGYFYKSFSRSHFKAWDSDLALPVPSDPEGSLRTRLTSFSREIGTIIESARHASGV